MPKLADCPLRNSRFFRAKAQTLRKLEVFAQIHGPCPRRRGELCRSAFFEDFPGGDDVSAIADGEGVTDVVVGDEDAETAGLEADNLALELTDVDGVDAREGLVEEDEAGVGQKAAGDLGAPPLPPDSVSPMD